MIKQGVEIWADIENAILKKREKLDFEQWVSLSLLLDYIKIRKKVLTKGGAEWNELHHLEHLLKEDKQKG
jgi:hypothetical protein